VDWSVQNYTGIELWNALSELKTVVPTKLHGLLYAYFPSLIGHQPSPATINKWDELLNNGQRVVAIGGSDAHAMHMKMGPLKRVIFPYEFHFRAVNTHVILTEPLTGDSILDRKLVYDAIGNGRAFVGYDLPASTKGFRFTAQGRDKTVIMGEEIRAKGGVTLQARLPFPAELRLIKDGQLLYRSNPQAACTHITTEPGVYRIEAYKNYLGRKRGWIYSNPIYVR
jgi:hypothetical protein